MPSKFLINFRYIGAHDRKQSLLSIVNHHDKFRVNVWTREFIDRAFISNARIRVWRLIKRKLSSIHGQAIKSTRIIGSARGNAPTAVLLRIYERPSSQLIRPARFRFHWWLDETRDNLLRVTAFFEFILDRDSIRR